ncbi:hypothetical protein GQR58_021865 [Nymphon striatum]|nr:hypothetical protein GQR58_021865 [Nymphon striatum]
MEDQRRKLLSFLVWNRKLLKRFSNPYISTVILHLFVERKFCEFVSQSIFMKLIFAIISLHWPSSSLIIFIFRLGKSVTGNLASLFAIQTPLVPCVTSRLKCEFLNILKNMKTRCGLDEKRASPLFDKFVKSDQTNIIDGSYTFTAVQNFVNIITKKYIDNVNVTELFNSLKETVNLTGLEVKSKKDDVAMTDIKATMNQALRVSCAKCDCIPSKFSPIESRVAIAIDESCKKVSARWKVPDPLKDLSLVPINAKYTERRLIATVQRKLKDPSLAEAYANQMRDLVEMGFVRKLTKNEITTPYSLHYNYQAVLLNYYMKKYDIKDSDGMLGQGDSMYCLKRTTPLADCRIFEDMYNQSSQIRYPGLLKMDSKFFKGTSRSVIVFGTVLSSECPGVKISANASHPIHTIDPSSVTFVHILISLKDQPRLFAAFGLDFIPNYVKLVFVGDHQVVVVSDEHKFQAFMVDESAAPKLIHEQRFEKRILKVIFYSFNIFKLILKTTILDIRAAAILDRYVTVTQLTQKLRQSDVTSQTNCSSLHKSEYARTIFVLAVSLQFNQYFIHIITDRFPYQLCFTFISLSSIFQVDFYGSGVLLFAAVNVAKDFSYRTNISAVNVVTNELHMDMSNCFFPTSALHFVEFNNHMFLIVAKKATHQGFGGLFIYMVGKNALEQFQVLYKVADRGIFPIDLGSVKVFDQQMYIFVLSDIPSENVLILKYEGAQGFNLYSKLTAKPAEKLIVFKDYLVLQSSGHSEIFKSKYRGKLFYNDST